MDGLYEFSGSAADHHCVYGGERAMNRKNRHERHPLDLCPVCGMDSGPRTHRLSTMYGITPAALSQRVTPSNPTPRKRGREGMRGNEDLSGVREMFHRHEPQCV